MRRVPLSRLPVRDRRASAAVEFAICGLALIAFIMVIINLGLLGFSVGTMQRGIQASARNAAVQAANNYVSSLAAGTAKYTCPSASTVAGYFNNLTGNVLPAASTSSSANPYLLVNWYNNSASTYIGKPPGVLVVLTITYKWTPFDFSPIGNVLTLRLTTISVVNGTVGGSVAIDSSCDTHS